MNVLPIVEKGLIVLSILAFACVLGFDFPAVSLLLSLMLLATFYMIATPFLVQSVLKAKLKDGMELPLLLITQVQLAVAIIGVLFKLMMFSGASSLLLISAIGLLFLSIVISLKQLQYDSFILKRMVVMGLLAAFFYWLPTHTWIRFRFWKHPEFAKSYIKHLENPNDSAYKAVWEQEAEKLH
ncbi:MAG: hypothetical protein ACOVP1_13495 [Bacteroidia bacterium]